MMSIITIALIFLLVKLACVYFDQIYACMEYCFVLFVHPRRPKIVIKRGLPSFNENKTFYDGWNSEPLTTKWLRVSMHVILTLFTQDHAVSFYASIKGIPIGMTATASLDDYYKNFDTWVMSALSRDDTTDDDKKFIEIHKMAREPVKLFIKTNSLENEVMYHNAGLMVPEIYRGKGISIKMMKHKLKELDSIVFTSTTNKYSARVMEACGYKLLKSHNYCDLSVKSDDTFNVYVWVPQRYKIEW